MPKKLNTLHVKQNMCDSSKFSDFDRPFINNTTTSAAHKYSLNVNTYSDLEANQSSQIHDDINEIDLLRLNNKINKFSDFSESIKEKQIQNVQCIIESNLSEPTKRKICQILSEVSSLSAQEKLFLYLRLPPESTECDPLRQPQNPLGSRSEINDTITWVRSHLKHDPKVSIPKQDVYSDYTAYCDRLDIKPLSTADFGKVMKQVFPEIKPRRLGTRGHSRYCYAAMRKATRLSPPHLPNMKSDLNSSCVVDEINNDSWQIIKMWSEEILNTTFQSLTELANFISKHNLNTQVENPAKTLFQKKKLQREIKSKRKFPETISTKKRRKKKNKTSLYSECFQKFKISTDLDENDKFQIDKMQINKYEIDLDQKPDRLDTQSVPINLTSDDKNYQFHSECAKNIDRVISGNITQTESKSPESFKKFASNTPFIDIKEEFEEEYNSNILCKKVRQAQQSKGLWVPPMDHTILNTPHYTSHNYSMGPPAQIQAHNLTSFNSNFNEVTAHRKAFNQDTSTVISKNLMQLSAKKQRCLQSKNECHVNDTENIDDDKNVLPENLGLPRERVISICNMDKHELDDYLIGDNSQDQEAELLQYFQPDDVNGNENYGAEKTHVNSTEDAIEIVQLRHYLHQSFQNNRSLSNQADQRIQAQQPNQYSMPFSGGSASASLAIMSQLSNRSELLDNEKPYKFGPRRKLNLNSRSTLISNNPNTKRKNFSFVPISLSGNISNDNNQFISPKSKYPMEKAGLHKQKSKKSYISFNMSDPMIGAIQTIENVASASAPPSPSVSQQKYQSHNIQNSFTLSNSFTQNVNNVPDCNYHEMVEYRSRSVPLHINTSPEFNKNENLTGLLSNSVTPTPIPTEFNDFNEPLLDFFSETNIQQPNPIEVSSLLDINIPFSNKNNEIKNKYIEKSECLNYTSRSNPCTPLPNNTPLNNNLRIDIFQNIKHNTNTKMFDTSKSVPSTPCVFTGSQFRYSPEINRDCLISGNTAEENLNCYQGQQLTGITMNNAITELGTANTDEIIMDGTPTRTMGSTTYN